MPSGSSSSSSDFEIVSSSTSRSAPRPRRAAAPTSSNLALGALPSPARRLDAAAAAHMPRHDSQHRPTPTAQAGSTRERDGACGSSPRAGAAAQAGASTSATAGEGDGKGKVKLIDTIEISSSDDSDDDRLPPPSSSRPRQVAATRPRVSLPHPSTSHRPRPAPRRSEPAPRSLATLTLSSSDSEDDVDMLPQPTAPARPSSSQSVAASGQARPAGAQPSGSRIPRAALQARDAARTMLGSASASSAPPRDAAPLPASTRQELATASQAQPPTAASRPSSSLGKSTSSASSLPRPSAVKPAARTTSTSAPRAGLPPSQPRLAASSAPRAPHQSATSLSGALQVRPDLTSTSAQHESAPSANRLPSGILSKYGPAAPSPRAAATASQPTAQPVRRPSTAASARTASSPDADVELVRVGRDAVRASSSSELQHGSAHVHLHAQEGVEEQPTSSRAGRAVQAVRAPRLPADAVARQSTSMPSPAAEPSLSVASAGAALLNAARTSTAGLPPPSAASFASRARPTARKSMGSRHADGARAPSSAAAASRSASPLGLRRGTARKSLGGRLAPALTRSPSSPSSSSTSASDDGGSDSSASSSTGAGSARRGQPERAAASQGLALPDASTTSATLPPSSAPSKATARKSTGGRAPVERPSQIKPAEPPLAAPTTKRKPPPSPASSTTSTDAPQKKRRRRYADDIVAESAIKEDGPLRSGRRLRKSRAVVEPVVEQAPPLVLEPDTVVADEMGDQDKVDQIEDKIEKFKLTEASEQPWNRLIAGPSFDVDAEFDISIQDYVNRRERRWARRHPDEHPLREGYKTLFELMVLEANAKEYSPRESARRPKIRILPPIGQSAHHWSSPPFEFIYTNRVVYSDGICPVQAPGCDCEGNCGSSTNRARCACRKRQIESSRARPGGHERSGHGDFAYVDGRLVDTVLKEQEPIIECNSECGCGPECINRVVGLRPSVSVDIFHTGKNGWGVRLAPTYTDEAGETHVARVIKRGEPLAIYAGELLRTADADARAQLVYMYTNRTYIYDLDCWTIAEDIHALAPPDTPIQSDIVPKSGAHKSSEHAAPSSSGKGKGKKKATPAPVDHDEEDEPPAFSSLYSIDAFNMGNWTRFSNHVCQGFNVAPRPVYIDDFDVSRPLWVYFAVRDILPGEEINISYAGETEPNPQQWGYTRAQWKAAADESRRKADKWHRCYCGKPLCRGRMFNNETASFWARGEGLPGS